jgi:hypothetical protein
VVSAKGYDDGFVVLTGGLQFMEVKGWKGGRVGAMASSGAFPCLRPPSIRNMLMIRTDRTSSFMDYHLA